MKWLLQICKVSHCLKQNSQSYKPKQWVEGVGKRTWKLCAVVSSLPIRSHCVPEQLPAHIALLQGFLSAAADSQSHHSVVRNICSIRISTHFPRVVWSRSQGPKPQTRLIKDPYYSLPADLYAWIQQHTLFFFCDIKATLCKSVGITQAGKEYQSVSDCIPRFLEVA